MTAPSLVDLLDERDLLLAVAIGRLGSADLAELAVQSTYAQWFALRGRARSRVADPYPWLVRVLEGVCAELAGCAPRHPSRVAAAPRPVPHTVRGARDALSRAFALACHRGDERVLGALLAPDVTAVADGGGKVRVEPGFVAGADAVNRFLRALFGSQPAITMTAQTVNAGGGALVRRGARVVAIVCLGVAGGRVRHVWIVVNPDKLIRWNGGYPSS